MMILWAIFISTLLLCIIIPRADAQCTAGMGWNGTSCSTCMTGYYCVAGYGSFGPSVTSTFAGTGTWLDNIGTASRFSDPRDVSFCANGLFALIADRGNHRIRRYELASGAVTTLAGSGLASFVDGIGTLASFNNPQGVSIDASCSFALVSDQSNNRIRQINITTGDVKTVAGSYNQAWADGSGTAAWFNLPSGISIDPSGSYALVADQNNNRIRRITIATGAVTTFVGAATAAWVDGTGTSALFNQPAGITIDPTGSFALVADQNNNRIRRVTIATGAVTTLAGSSTSGNTNSVGTSASFTLPFGVTISPNGIYAIVTDYGSSRIRRITISTRSVAALAGSGNANWVDGTGTSASFSSPAGISTDPGGTYVLVADSGNGRIRRITLSTAAVSTLAGSAPVALWTDGIGSLASFNNPIGISIAPSGSFVLVVDQGNMRIRRIETSSGSVTTLAGNGGPANIDGVGTASSFWNPYEISISPNGTFALVTDRLHNIIRHIAISTGAVTTIAGAENAGWADDIGTSASFNMPTGLSIDPSGKFALIADSYNHRIRRIVIATAVVSTLAGSGQVMYGTDGTGSVATFYSPRGISIDPSGSFALVIDQGNTLIRRINITSGAVVTWVGSTASGNMDGIGTAAKFQNLFGVAISPNGTFALVTDYSTNRIRRIAISTGEVTTFAGIGNADWVDGVGTSASFNSPSGLSIDPSGKFALVADSANFRIRRIVLTTAVVSTMAGSGNSTWVDGMGSLSSFNNPSGVSVDPSNGLFALVADDFRIRRIEISSGAVSTLAGWSNSGYADGTGTLASFTSPTGMTIDPTGSYALIVERYIHCIRKLVIATGVVTTFAGTRYQEWVDGIGTLAAFSFPFGISIDPSGSFALVSDADNNRIRRINITSSLVSTLAGSGPWADGIGTSANFFTPSGISIDPSGTFALVADTGNNRIRHILISSGTVTTLAGSSRTVYSDGIGSLASFAYPVSVTIEPRGLFACIVDQFSNRIRKLVIETAVVTTLAGSTIQNWIDGFGTSTAFNQPAGISIDPSGSFALVSDSGNNRIRRIAIGLECQDGQYCPSGASAPLSCTAGYFCSAGSRYVCTTGYFCPPGSISKTVCAPGLYCGFTGLSAVSGVCSAGFYCPSGSSSATQVLCTAGQYCPAGSSIYALCEVGFYCPIAMAADHVSCPWGSYCSSTGLSVVSGVCSAGFFCPSGSSSATQYLTQRDVAPCAAGTGWNGTGCSTCVQGYYCVSGYGSFGPAVTSTLAGSGPWVDSIGTASRFYQPYDVAINPDGSFALIADFGNHRIRRIALATGAVTTLAGSGSPTFSDGIGTFASFNYPRGVSIDPSGSFAIIADSGNNRIRYIVISSSVVTTLAGSGNSGWADGNGTFASFNMPYGISIDPAGSYALITDQYNYRIRRIGISTGVVTTLAGSGNAAWADGIGILASFNSPTGISIDPSGTFALVVDSSNRCIRRISIATGSVTTLAGSSTYGTANGNGTSASFSNPYGVSISANGMFAWVTDNSYIRRIALATGTVTTLTGSGSSGWVDGDGTLASFNSPAGISIDPSMTFALVADHSNNRIRRITIATGSVTTLAGSSTWIDGIGTSASFYNPFGISIDPSGSFALVADTNNNRIRLVVIATGAVTTFAGSGSSGSVNGNGNSASFGGLRGVTISPNSTFALICDSSYIRRIVFSTGAVTTLAGSSSSGWADGNGTLASFSSPAGISIDPSMTFALVADQSNNRIRRIALATSVVTTLAGSGSWVDGNGTSALFKSPYGVSIDPSGSFALIADQSNKRIRRVSIATGDVTTLAGSGSYGNSNGNGTSASFSNPYFITISPNGMFALVSDSSLIRRITIATGEVTTLAGSGSYSWADGNGTLASFRQTAGVSIDPSGTFALVADQSNHRIRRIVIATAVVTTLAGSGNVDWIDGNATSSAFSNPCGVSIDPSGSFALVAEFSNNRIRRVSIATGAVTTLAGSGSNVPADGVGTSASFNGPSGVTIDPSGTIALVADSYSSRVRKIVISTGVVTTLAGSSNQAWVDGIGTLAAFIQPIGISIDPSGSFAVVSDQGSNCIRRINIGSGFVSTLAGAGSFANGIGTSAYFSYPYDISIAPSGSYALIADLFNNRIRQITIATGAVTTLAGSRSNSPVDGIGTLASFNWPAGVKIDPSGSFALIVDYGNFRIRKIVIATRVVTTLSGSSTQSWIDGIGTSAAFYQPAGISIGPNGVFALVSDAFNGRIRRLDLGLECGNGEYCPPGSGNSSMCNPGYFCTGGFQTLCSAGYFCPSGSSSATNFPCAAGQYCPAGSSNYTLCEVGFYCPNQTTAVHVPCMAGSYCGTNGLSVVSGLCNAGYYCPSGASSATQVSCSVGQYCPVGSSNYTLCEVGFFCPVAQAAVHVSCTPGFYCSSPGLLVMTGQCNAGYYCPSGSSSATQLPCVSGQYCPLGMSSPQNCTAGSYCPTSSLQLACSSGSYCPLGSTAQSPCMGGYYCPTTTSRVQCSSGSYCPPGSTEVLQCELGFYCPITLASVHMPCSSGSYCGSLGLSIVSGLCTAGFYCPSGSSSATQTSCAVGQYCPAGSSNYTLCEVGFYCPNVSAAVHVACSPGSFCNSSGLSEVSGACSAGYYCPSGSSSATQFPCVSGQYCPVGMSTPQNCAVGSYCATPAFQVACSSGSYCPANSTAQTYCSVGSFCPTPSLKLNCSSGYYCPVSSTSQSLCAAGSICTTPSTQVVCSSGSYCPPGSTVSTQCTVGSVCVNVTSMVTCASGSYCPAGSTVQNSCAAGSYCISPSFQVTCASGSYCPAGSTASTLCAAGSYCPTPSSQIVCDAGAICPPGSTSMMMPTSSGIVLIGNNSDATTNTKCATASLNLTSVVAFNTLTITVGISVSLNSFVFADASKGQCFGCSGLAFPGIVSYGYNANWVTGNWFLWTASFPTANSFQICASRFLQSSSTWTEPDISAKYVVSTTTCAAGQYINSNFLCTACPLGTYSATGSLSACLPCSSGQYANAAATGCLASCPAGQYNSSGTCTSCGSNCTSCGVDGTCLSCSSGYSLTYPNICTLVRNVSAATSIFSYGQNTIANAVVCQTLSISTAQDMALDSVSLRTNTATTTFSSSSGYCYGCSNSTVPPVYGAGYPTNYPQDSYTWQLSYPSATSIKMCVSRPLGGNPIGTWGGLGLTLTVAVNYTKCGVGQYINSNFVCASCPAGYVGSSAPLVSSMCSGPCASGTYSTFGSSSCSSQCPLGQYLSGNVCLSCSGSQVLSVDSMGCLASCPTGQYNNSGMCSYCADNCATCTSAGCTQCKTAFASYGLSSTNICTLAGSDQTTTGTVVLGANAEAVIPSSVITMPLSATRALKSVSLNVASGNTTYTAAAGNCGAPSCANSQMPSVISAGSAGAATLQIWNLSFVSLTSFRVTVSHASTSSNSWNDNALAFSYSYVTTACQLGQYINSYYLCAPCPAGYFGNFAPLTTSSCSGQCTSGQYCPAGTSSPQNCAAGNYCATPMSQVSCSSGSYCPANSTAQTACSAGSYCPTPSTSVNCSSGYYCPASTVSPELCAAGTYCSTPSTQVACVSGTYCPAGSTISAICFVGSYCVNSSVQIACSSGTYCESGSTAEVVCSAGYYCRNPKNKIECPSGKYCPAGTTTSPPACTAGYYCTTPMSRVACVSGTFCPLGSTVATACEAGFYCPTAMASAHVSCSPGSYCNSSGLSEVSGLCSAGYYCPAESSSATQSPCVAGQYCPAGSSNYTLCEIGFYCPTATAAVHELCPAGSFCGSFGLISVSGPCSSGYFCPNGSINALGGNGTKMARPCDPGYFCPSGSSSATQGLCPSKYFCPGNGVNLTSCPAGSYCPGLGNSAPVPCTVGYFCPPLSDAPIDCPIGSYCVAGLLIPCSNQYYCPGGNVSSPLRCPGSQSWCDGSDRVTTCIDQSGISLNEPFIFNSNTLRNQTVLLNSFGSVSRYCAYFQLSIVRKLSIALSVSSGLTGTDEFVSLEDATSAGVGVPPFASSIAYVGSRFNYTSNMTKIRLLYSFVVNSTSPLVWSATVKLSNVAVDPTCVPASIPINYPCEGDACSNCFAGRYQTSSTNICELLYSTSQYCMTTRQYPVSLPVSSSIVYLSNTMDSVTAYTAQPTYPIAQSSGNSPYQAGWSESWIFSVPSSYNGGGRINLSFLRFELLSSDTVTVCLNANNCTGASVLSGGTWNNMSSVDGYPVASAFQTQSSVSVSFRVVTNQSIGARGFIMSAFVDPPLPVVTQSLIVSGNAVVACSYSFSIDASSLILNPQWMSQSPIQYSTRSIAPESGYSLSWLSVSLNSGTGKLSVSSSNVPITAITAIGKPILFEVTGTNSFGFSASFNISLTVIAAQIPDSASTFQCTSTNLAQFNVSVPVGTIVVDASSALYCNITARLNNVALQYVSVSSFTLLTSPANTGTITFASNGDSTYNFNRGGQGQFQFIYNPPSSGTQVSLVLYANNAIAQTTPILAASIADSASLLACNPGFISLSESNSSSTRTTQCTLQSRRTLSDGSTQPAFTFYPFFVNRTASNALFGSPYCTSAGLCVMPDGDGANTTSFTEVTPYFSNIFTFNATLPVYEGLIRIVVASSIVTSVQISSHLSDQTSILQCGFRTIQANGTALFTVFDNATTVSGSSTIVCKVVFRFQGAITPAVALSQSLIVPSDPRVQFSQLPDGSAWEMSLLPAASLPLNVSLALFLKSTNQFTFQNYSLSVTSFADTSTQFTCLGDNDYQVPFISSLVFCRVLPMFAGQSVLVPASSLTLQLSSLSSQSIFVDSIADDSQIAQRFSNDPARLWRSVIKGASDSLARQFIFVLNMSSYSESVKVVLQDLGNNVLNTSTFTLLSDVDQTSSLVCPSVVSTTTISCTVSAAKSGSSVSTRFTSFKVSINDGRASTRCQGLVSLPSSPDGSQFSVSTPANSNSGVVYINLCVANFLSAQSPAVYRLASTSSIIVASASSDIPASSISCRRSVVSVGSGITCHWFGFTLSNGVRTPKLVDSTSLPLTVTKQSTSAARAVAVTMSISSVSIPPSDAVPRIPVQITISGPWITVTLTDTQRSVSQTISSVAAGKLLSWRPMSMSSSSSLDQISYSLLSSSLAYSDFSKLSTPSQLASTGTIQEASAGSTAGTERFTSMSCSTQLCMAVCETGYLYSWGTNNEYQSLGRVTSLSYDSRALITVDQNGWQHLLPSGADLYKTPAIIKAAVNVADHSTAVVTDDGNVFLIGSMLASVGNLFVIPPNMFGAPIVQLSANIVNVWSHCAFWLAATSVPVQLFAFRQWQPTLALKMTELFVVNANASSSVASAMLVADYHPDNKLWLQVAMLVYSDGALCVGGTAMPLVKVFGSDANEELIMCASAYGHLSALGLPRDTFALKVDGYYSDSVGRVYLLTAAGRIFVMSLGQQSSSVFVSLDAVFLQPSLASVVFSDMSGDRVLIASDSAGNIYSQKYGMFSAQSSGFSGTSVAALCARGNVALAAIVPSVAVLAPPPRLNSLMSESHSTMSLRTGSSQSVIAAALAAATLPGTVLRLAAGTYPESMMTSSLNSLTLLADAGPGTVVIQCCGVPTCMQFTGDQLTLNGITIQCDQSAQCISTQPYVVPSGKQHNLINVTFQGCSNTDNGGVGGAVSVLGSLVVQDSQFISNSAPVHGGAIACTTQAASLSVSNTVFTSNIASQSGGALYIQKCTADLQSLTFKSNSASQGGAIFGQQSVALLVSTLFDSNSASLNGGAALFRDSTVTSSNSLWMNNSALQSGGAFYIDSTVTSMNGANFTSNRAGPVLCASCSGGALFCQGQRVLNIIWSNFERNSIGSAGTGGAVFMSSCLSNISQTLMTQNSAGTGGAIAVLSQANLVMDALQFVSNTAAQSGGALYLTTCTVSCTSASFIRNTAAENGGALYASVLAVFVVTNGVTFTSNAAGQGGGAVYWDGSIEPSTQGSVFSANQAVYGPNKATQSRQLVWSRLATGLIVNSRQPIFGAGSAIQLQLLDGYNQLVASDSLSSLTLQTVALSALPSNRPTLAIAGNSSSAASPGTGSITGTISCKFIQGNCSFGSNSGNSFAVEITPQLALPLKANVLLASGSSLSSPIILIPSRSCVPGEFIDVDQCSACPIGTFSNSSQAAACMPCQDGYYADSPSSTICKVCPDGFQCVDQKSKYSCSSQSYRVASMTKSGSCTLCPPSSSADVSRTFCRCDIGYYMVKDPTSSRADKLLCKSCPLGADCTSSGTTINNVVALRNYWSELQNTNTSFISCLNSGCSGGTTKCEPEYDGNLCTSCKRGYSRDSSYECTICPPASSTFVQGFGIIVAVCLLCALIIFFTLSNTQYNIKKEIRLENEKQKALAARQQIRNEKLLALSIKRAQEAVTQGLVAKEESNFLPDEKDPEIAKIIQEYEEQAAETLKQEEANQSAYPTFSILIKIFASFLQFNSLAAAFNFQWPDAVMVVMNLQKKLAEIAANIISVDCAAYQSGTTFSLFYMKKIVIAFLPPIVVLIPSAFILLWAGIWKLRGLTLSTETMKITLVTSVVVVLFFILPTITKQAFGMISCVKLGINPTDYYILDAMNELCWDSQHILYVCLVCLPMIILYVVGIPVVSFRILWQNRLALQTAQLKQYFFFLYTGYENEYWFWEYTIIARKIVLVGISVFFQTNVQLQSLMALMLVVVCLLVHIRYQPFLHDTSDKLEFISLFISFLTFFFGLILFSSEVRDYARVVISFIIVALNLLFVLYSGYLIVRAAIEYFRDRLHAARLEEQELQSAAVAQQKSVQPCVEIQTDSGSANQQNSMVTPHAHLSDAKPIVSDVHSSLSPHAQRDLRRVAVDDFVPQLDTKVDTVIVEESEQDQQAVKSGFVNEIELTLTSNVLFDRVQVVDVSAAPDNTLSDVLVDADPSQGHAAESTDVQQVEHSSDQSSENEVEIAVKSIAEPSPQGATPHVDEIESEYSADNHVVKDIELASQHSAEIHIESHNISDYEASQTEEHSEIVDASSSDPDQTTVQNQVVSAEAVEPIQKELATSSNALTAITLNRTVSVGIQNPHFAEIALSSTSEESFAAEEEPRHDDDSEELENSDH